MIDRRRFLAGATAAAALSIAGPTVRRAYGAEDVLPAGGVNRVAVIGAGIVGASIAYYLSKRGCEVVLVEKRAPAAQASGSSFAWINASYFDTPRSYFDLRAQSLNEYLRLTQEIDIPIRWGGSLEWYHTVDQEREITTSVQRIQGYGAETWMVDGQRAADIEPNLIPDTELKIVHSPRDGAIDAVGTTRKLVDRVRAHGGEVIFPAAVTKLRETTDGVNVTTDFDAFEVDLAVIASGAGANDFARMLNLSSEILKPATPGIIVTTTPMEPILNTVAYTTDTHFHQLGDGRVIIGEKAGPPDTVEHGEFLTNRPNEYPSAEIAMQHAHRIIEVASRYVPKLRYAEVDRVSVGWRPLPIDGLPIIGRPKNRSNIYIATMHSGVTLAPIVGRLAAMEILDGVLVDMLDDFRIERL